MPAPFLHIYKHSQMQIVFLAGPFRSDPQTNIEIAKTAAINLINDGYAVICPHLNTGCLYGVVDEAIIGNMYQRIIDSLDPFSSALVVLPGWEHSCGTLMELDRARKNNILVVEYNPTPEEPKPHIGRIITVEELDKIIDPYPYLQKLRDESTSE